MQVESPIQLIDPAPRDASGAIEVADEVVDPAPAGSAVALLSPIRAIQAGVAKMVVEGKSATWDVDTKVGEEEARRFRAACVKVRASAKAAYELGNKPLLDAQREARDLVARITEDIDAVEKIWDAKIKAKEDRKAREKAEREQRERERIAAIRHRIEWITHLPVTGAACRHATELSDIITQLSDLEISDEAFAEFVDEARGARERVLSTLTQLHAALVEREREAARLEAQRIEQERIAADLRRRQEQAEADAAARQAEIERQMAERKAALDQQAAELKRMQEEADARLAAQRRAAEEEQAARERAAAEERAEVARQAADLRRQQDAFDAELREASEKLERDRVAAEQQRQAELAAIEQAAQAAAAAAPPAAPPPAVALRAPSRPTDEEILDALCQRFQCDEQQVLGWIADFNVGAQMLRLEEAA